MIIRLSLNGREVFSVESSISSDLNICVTGELESMSRNMVKWFIEANGGHFQTSVTSATNYLVCNKVSTSSKFQQAQKLGIKIINEAELFKLFNTTLLNTIAKHGNSDMKVQYVLQRPIFKDLAKLPKQFKYKGYNVYFSIVNRNDLAEYANDFFSNPSANGGKEVTVLNVFVSWDDADKMMENGDDLEDILCGAFDAVESKLPFIKQYKINCDYCDDNSAVFSTTWNSIF